MDTSNDTIPLTHGERILFGFATAIGCGIWLHILWSLFP